MRRTTVCKLSAATASLGLREGPCEICTQQQKQQHPMWVEENSCDLVVGRGSSGSTSSPPPTTERHPSSFVLVVDMASKTTTTTTTTPTAAASKIEGAHLWKKATAQQLLSSVVVLGLRHRPRLFAWNRELKRRIVVVSIDQQAGKRRSYSYSSQHRASRSL